MDINASTTINLNNKTFTADELVEVIELVSNYCMPANSKTPNLTLARAVLADLIEDKMISPNIDRIGWIVRVANMVSFATENKMLGTWSLGDGTVMFDGLENELNDGDFGFETTEQMVQRILIEECFIEGMVR